VRLSDFDYELPPELIAQHPAQKRTQSRLLHVDGASGAIEDRVFADVVELLDANDLLVVNDTRVIKARLKARKDSGGEVEMLVERVLDPHRALAQARSSKPLKPGRKVLLADGAEIEVIGRRGEFYELRFPEGGVLAVLDAQGEVPLPPYIAHRAASEDEARYQTVYARSPGAVAAPTAGLHFDDALLAALKAKGVELASLTLHVGAGTFQPVRVDDVSKHVEAGGGFYVCDTGVQSEACVPILDDARQVIGIVDAEAKPRGFFGAERLVVVAALALVAAAVLP